MADKKENRLMVQTVLRLAEGVGFEPTVQETHTTVFETVPFNRSGTPPAAGQCSTGQCTTQEVSKPPNRKPHDPQRQPEAWGQNRRQLGAMLKACSLGTGRDSIFKQAV
jgi:hypothetical protein